MFNLSDGVKKALILIPTQPLPAKTRVAQRRKRLAKLELAKAHAASFLIIGHPKSGNTWLKVMISRLYQLRYDSAIGRRWAVGELQRHADDPGIGAALVAASQADEFWAVREKAVRALDAVQSDMATDALMRSALDDENSRVRAAALQTLAAKDDESHIAFFQERHAAEESPLARAAALAALERPATP